MKTYTAQKVLKKFWDGNLPVDVEQIAKEMGVYVSGTDLPENVSGSSSKIVIGDGISLYVIFHKNTGESEVRRRFTVAHELGHICLNHITPEEDGKKYRTIIDGPYNVISSDEEDRDPEEVEANKFAAELLMPADRIISAYKSLGKNGSLKDLAKKFKVSMPAVYFRLKNLGYNPIYG